MSRVLSGAVGDLTQLQSSNRLFFDAEDIFDHRVGAQFDVGMGDGTIEHDLGGAEGIAPVEQSDFGREAGEEQRLFHGRVAAADHGDGLATEEEAIAGSATGDPVTDQCLFAGQTQPARAWPRRQ